MTLTIFFTWWYGPGWKNSFIRVTQRVDTIAAELSMGILAFTLFEPWKQITSYSGPNDSFDTKLRVWIDNVFARTIGFIIRLSVLVFGIVACVTTLLFGILLALLWPVVPLTPAFLILLTVVQL